MRNIDKSFAPADLQDVLERRLGIPLTTPFVVAYSGGCDSHVLLHALHALAAPRLRAVHIDHGLQSVSGAWSEHCQRVCLALRVPCTTERIEVEPQAEESIESAARRLRYARLATHVGAAEVLLTAHHQDDQAETLLLALLRGAGVHGLGAMPALTQFSAGHLARPLLGFTRNALAAYARAEGLAWVEDESNRNERMSRNFLRARVLPLLEQRWPAATRVLVRAAENSADSASLLDEIALADLTACAATDGASVSLVHVQRLSAPRQRNLVRYWIRSRGFYAPSAQHLDQILDQINNPSNTGHACVDWPGVEVQRYRDQLTMRRRSGHIDPEPARSWQPPQALELPNMGLRLCVLPTVGEGLSQMRVAHAAVTVRFRQGGEVFQLSGRRHHHKLKKLLQQTRVPPWERGRLPLIYADNELAAVGDRWVCARFAAQGNEPGWRIVLDRCN